MVEGEVIFSVDADVIHINLQPFFHYHVGEDVVHEGLECGLHVAKFKEHYCQFKESKGGDEGGFPLVFLMDVDVVVVPSDAKFHKEGGIFHVVNELWDEWKGVCIPNSVGVKIPVVLAGM